MFGSCLSPRYRENIQKAEKVKMMRNGGVNRQICPGTVISQQLLQFINQNLKMPSPIRQFTMTLSLPGTFLAFQGFSFVLKFTVLGSSVLVVFESSQQAGGQVNPKGWKAKTHTEKVWTPRNWDHDARCLALDNSLPAILVPVGLVL
jgi:hypothetical protein